MSGELDDADRLVAQTLAHIACVAILQEHAPTPSTVMPQLRSALASRVIVEQAKGFLRETLDVSVDEAFRLLRSYARANGEHLTDVARRLMTDRHARPVLVSAIGEFATPRNVTQARCRAVARRTASSTSRSATTCELHVLGLAHPDEPVERDPFTDPGPGSDDPDRLVDHRAGAQRTLQLLGSFLSVVEQLPVVHRHRRRPCELRAQLHGVLAERVAAAGVGVDGADQLIADQHRQRQRGMHAHPGHPTAEARPAPVTSQRSADSGPPRLHTRDARAPLGCRGTATCRCLRRTPR